MVLSIGITYKGIKGAQEALRDFNIEIPQNVEGFLKELGDALVEDMVTSAPVDTGFMAEHIGVSEVSNEKLVIDSEAPYSGFVEFGTVKMAAQPFFNPPIDNLSSNQMADQFGRDATSEWERLVAKYKDH